MILKGLSIHARTRVDTSVIFMLGTEAICGGTAHRGGRRRGHHARGRLRAVRVQRKKNIVRISEQVLALVVHVEREADDVRVQVDVFLDGAGDPRVRRQLPDELEHVLLLGHIAVEQNAVQAQLKRVAGVVVPTLVHLVLELVTELGE